MTIDDFNMSDVDLEFDNYEMFDTSCLQTEEFKDVTSSCSSMGQSRSFVESSIHVESIQAGNTVDSQNVGKSLHVSDFLGFLLRYECFLCSCICRL